VFEDSQIICFIMYHIEITKKRNLPKLRKDKLVINPISLGIVPVKKLRAEESNKQNDWREE